MAAGDLDAPIIPLLINNTINPDDLNGLPLSTYAKYSEPCLGDRIYQSWLGKAEDGTPVDVGNIPIDIDPDNEGALGFLMQVTNFWVLQLDKGQVFYSFYLERVTGEPREESKRIHFGIGKHGLLSAPQIKESHDLQLDPDTIEGSLTVASTPYGIMAAGDVVKLIWKGERANGTPGPVVTLPSKTLSSSDTDPTNNPGQVLTWAVSKANVVALRGGKLSLHCEITYAASGIRADTLSAERSFLVTPPVAPQLPMASVKDLIGNEISPGLFPQGLRVVIPVYPGIRVGDDVLVYGTRLAPGSAVSKNTVRHLIIDSSHIESGRIEVPIAAQWLLDNLGSNVSLRYQYARPDAAGSGASLLLSIREPRFLPTPTVDRSVAPGDRDELNPVLAINGAYITIPSAATVAEGDVVTACWSGFGPSGSYQTQVPSQLEPLKFKVPPDVLPPNFGRTVEVTYQVAGESAEQPLTLYIRPLASHPGITCERAQIGQPATLKLSDVPVGGVQLLLEQWSFISTQQQVRLWLSAGGIDQREIIAVRSVLPAEVLSGVKVQLLPVHLAGIATNAVFTLTASASFDGGHSTVVFNGPLQLKLLA